MTDKFEVLVVGYGLGSVKLFETDDVEKASGCCVSIPNISIIEK